MSRRPFAACARAYRRAFAGIRRMAVPPVIAGGAALCLAAAVSVSLALLLWPAGDAGPPRAVIIDQLSFTDANPAFIDEATAMLGAAGYEVDYVPPDEVTVDFYRDLPRRRYDLIVVRSHSTQERVRHTPILAADGTPLGGEAETIDAIVGLFTNETYSRRTHLDEQRDRQLGYMSYPGSPERGRFFGFWPEFVDDGMRGNFHGATFVLMGCGGLNSTGMAEALVNRGVSRFISWDNLVTATHTDLATERLLKYLLDGQDAGDAAAQTMVEVGPDPSFGSRLAAYP
jgi:hypothetical protein